MLATNEPAVTRAVVWVGTDGVWVSRLGSDFKPLPGDPTREFCPTLEDAVQRLERERASFLVLDGLFSPGGVYAARWCGTKKNGKGGHLVLDKVASGTADMAAAFAKTESAEPVARPALTP